MTITIEKLDEIERGLEGVTAGPWRYVTTPVLDGEDCSIQSPKGIICDDTPYYPTAPLPADMRHIARLDPTTVAELVRLARIGLAAEAAKPTTPEIPEGFTPWDGSADLPPGVGHDDWMEVVFRRGSRLDETACCLFWRHDEAEELSDIIAYRKVTP